jgi:hypothetical protein
MNATLNTTRDSIKKCLDSYGKRAFNAAADNGADYKALSHALRVAIQARHLLTRGEITFPLEGNELKTIRQIKFHETDMTYDAIVEYIESEIQIVEMALNLTTLPAQPDRKWIEEFLLNQYKEV